ncbi:hypothetical protein ACFSTJ_12145 [Ottowia pentelensis]|uniref:hypothetical protein n=1 Tax=Ottowia pentelensis TaxID=511108 RepID=UPI0036250494
MALAGCAGLQPQTTEQIVQQRAQQRWDALVAGDFAKAWTYSTPSFRQRVKQNDYRDQFGRAGQWTAAKVESVTCKAERCTAQVSLTARLLFPGFKNQLTTGEVPEIWVRDDGQWWYLPPL